MEIRYAGVVLGKSEEVRPVRTEEPSAGADAEAAETLFVAFSEPLPVGTLVELVAGTGPRRARVTAVNEGGPDPRAAGMQLRLLTAEESEALPATPIGIIVDDRSAPLDTSEAAEEAAAASSEPSNGAAKKKRRRRR